MGAFASIQVQAQSGIYAPYYTSVVPEANLKINPYRQNYYRVSANEKTSAPYTSRWPIGYNRPLPGQLNARKTILGTPKLGNSQSKIAPNVWKSTPPTKEDLLRREVRGRSPLISEIKGSILQHDAAFLGDRKESGIDISTEILFRSPGFMDLIGSPHPHIGLVLNTSGDTNALYTGLAWQWHNIIWDGFFIGLSLGLAVHDGKLTTFESGSQDEKELGSRVLFREALEVGYQFNNRHSLSFVIDHFSNANIETNNEGLDSFGIRYGYKF